MKRSSRTPLILPAILISFALCLSSTHFDDRALAQDQKPQREAGGRVDQQRGIEVRGACAALHRARLQPALAGRVADQIEQRRRMQRRRTQHEPTRHDEADESPDS